jgi:predicted aconitase with swiveling domain
MNEQFVCRKICEGKANGEVLMSDHAFCFYLVDPTTGVVIEPGHDLYGQSIADKILVFPNGKGSSVVQADGIYQLKVKGNAPKAMVIQNPDTTLVASAIILDMPSVHGVEDDFYKSVKTGDIAEVDADAGNIKVIEKAENADEGK